MFLKNLLAIATMALMAFANAFAADGKSVVSKGDPLDAVAAHDKTSGGGGTIFTPVSVNDDGSVTVRFDRLIGVEFKETVGDVKAFRGPVTDGPTKRPVWNFHIPDGWTVHAIRLGNDWGEMGAELAQVDIPNKSVASGALKGGTVTLTIPKHPSGKPCAMLNWVVTPAGSTAPEPRFWGSHPNPGNPWVVPNVNTSPRTGWCVRDNQIVTVDEFDKRIRAAMAKKK